MHGGVFGHLKDEFYRGRELESFGDFASGPADYIAYRDTGRYRVGLKGMTPVQYRGHSVGAA